MQLGDFSTVALDLRQYNDTYHKIHKKQRKVFYVAWFSWTWSGIHFIPRIAFFYILKLVSSFDVRYSSYHYKEFLIVNGAYSEFLVGIDDKTQAPLYESVLFAVNYRIRSADKSNR